MANAIPRIGYSASALKTLTIEADAIDALKASLTSGELHQAFNRAVDALARTSGRVIVTGMGKSGHIARKIASTMRSTGTPALFLHPGEASHGDLGLICPEDIVLALTWSGATSELDDIIYFCKSQQVPLIVATSKADSKVGRAADILLSLPHVREACPNELAPTSSTTLQLVLGDAIAVALIEARGFTSLDFRRYHPGGRLGALFSTLADVMGTGDSIPSVGANETIVSATVEMSRKRYGCTAVVDGNAKLIGAFTDGDLRRCIAVHDLSDPIVDHMSPNPLTAPADMLASEALRLLNENAVSVLFVTQDDHLAGIVHLHDIVRLGVG